MGYDFLDKIPKIDKNTSEIFKVIVEEYGNGSIFSKNDIINLLNQKNLLGDVDIKYDLSIDKKDPIYSFDVERKKRGRPSKKNKEKDHIIYSNINIDNISWDKVFICTDKNICKYWRYYIKSNTKVILNQGIKNNNIYEKGLVVEKTFIDKENLDIFINKNIEKKLENDYFVL